MGFPPQRGPGEVSYRNNSEGQSQEQRERRAYRVSAHGKLEDYLWICSRTGRARRDRRLPREIRGVPAVQRRQSWSKAMMISESRAGSSTFGALGEPPPSKNQMNIMCRDDSTDMAFVNLNI